MTVTSAQRQRFHDAAIAGARWFAGSQFRMQKPYWDANHGRFIYTMHLGRREPILGLNWTQARGIFCLLAAWELSGDADLLEPAERALDYIKILQISDAPKDPHRQFAIREQVPQSVECAPRDASEACLGLLFMYRATGDADALRRAINYERWWQRTVKKPDGWPCNFVYFDGRPNDRSVKSFQAGHAPIFYGLWKATGVARYRRELLRLADASIERFMRDDGAIISAYDPHHSTPSGEVLNDDGMMAALLCAHQASGRKRYLDACLRHADWIQTRVDPPLPIISSLPSMCTFLVELSEVTGDERHRDWAARMMRRHVLPLQVRAKRDPLSNGAFRGEDEPVHYYGPKSAKPTDFICTRTTAYATLACGKLAGLVGPYYGALGWERRLPKRGKRRAFGKRGKAAA